MTPRKSTGAYPANWNEIAKRVKDAARWRCVRCNEPHDPVNGYCLTVHHLELGNPFKQIHERALDAKR